MSEAADAEVEDLDLPLDDEQPEVDERDDEDAPEDEGDEDEAAAARAAAAKKAKEGAQGDDLPPEEIRKRYDNTTAALREERGKRRELERRLEAIERGEGRSMEARQPRQERQQEEDIDPEVDPMGALRQLRAKVAAYEAEERMEAETQQQRQAKDEAIAQVERAFEEHEADFRDEHPDYDAAAKHYAESRARELLSFGIQPKNVQTMLREEFANLAAMAIRARKNPAAVVYEAAKGRGYAKGKAAPADADKADKGAGSKLKDIARGARATSALQTGGGRSSTGVDAETIARINIRTPEGRAAFQREFAKLEQEAKAGGGRR